MTTTASIHATYAALSWSAFTFFGVLGTSWLIRPRQALPGRFWPFTFKVAFIAAVIVGLLVLVLGNSFVWEVK